MNRLERLFGNEQVSVTRFDHQPESVTLDPEEEVCRDYAIHFVEAGSFRLETQRGSWLLSPGAAFVSRPGAVHRYSHDEQRPSDVCVSVRFARGLFAGARDVEDPLTPDVPDALALSNRLSFLKLRLAKLASAADALALESLACELIAAVRSGGDCGRLYRVSQLKWYAERVEAAREKLEALYWEPHSLAPLAASVGMSPFQFARVFRELTGEPPHKYLLRVRLDRASRMLLDGKSVTETCFEVGFSNLSHFTRSFRRRFGCAPSSFKSRGISPAHI
ncbi:MAG: AraC family transcriptional regulator [Acidobacteriota bacterium]|nr:AraC family transcriptional regulator [Acidobacteriota bacterium]